MSVPGQRLSGWLALVRATNQPCWEFRRPKPGYRHNREVVLVPHRFPIKGGLTWGQAMLWSIHYPNPLLALCSTGKPTCAGT
jgi:hypothetical protein